MACGGTVCARRSSCRWRDKKGGGKKWREIYLTISDEQVDASRMWACVCVGFVWACVRACVCDKG